MSKKHFTVVLEFIADDGRDRGLKFDPLWLRQELSDALDGSFAFEVSFQIMEVIEAPYGPQHGPKGLYLSSPQTDEAYEKQFVREDAHIDGTADE